MRAAFNFIEFIAFPISPKNRTEGHVPGHSFRRQLVAGNKSSLCGEGI